MDPLRALDSMNALVIADTTLLRTLSTSSAVPQPGSLTADKTRMQALINLTVGRRECAQGRFNEGEQLMDVAAELLQGTGDERWTGSCLFMQGRADLMQNKLVRAISRFEQVLGIIAREPYPDLQARVEYGIGQAYTAMGNNGAARPHFEKSVSLASDPDTRFYSLHSLLGTEVSLGMYDAAGQSLHRLESVVDSVSFAAHSRVDLAHGEFFLAQGRYAEAITFLEAGLEKEIASGILKTYPPWFMSRLSEACRLAGRHDEAVEWAEKGLRWCEQYKLPKETQDNEQQMYQALEAQGNKAAAFDHLQHYLAMRDSTTNTAASDALASALMRSEFEAVQRADSLKTANDRLIAGQELEHERTRRNIILVAGLGLLVIIGTVFRQRNRIQKERDRSEELLLNILPMEVAEELKSTGQAVARDIENVSILFTDFKDFTQLSEQLNAQELVSEINTCFRAFDAILAKRGVEKIKTIGDAYMAAGGMPIPSADSVRCTVHAALDMQAFMRSYKAERAAQGKPAFEMRVGIHTGPVVAGIVGVKKFQYDIWGDTVNTASRMESSGEVGQINLSDATYVLVKNEPDLRFTPRGKVQVKGKGELEMYFVERT